MTSSHKRTASRGTLLSVTACLAMALALLSVLAPGRAKAAPPLLLWERCLEGSAAGECRVPGSVDVDQSSGVLYVVDKGNYRVDAFDPWGAFQRTWGWGVVASGPGNEPGNEIHEFTVDATAGSFSLFFSANSLAGEPARTPPIPFDASAETVEAALRAATDITPKLRPNPVEADVSGPDGGPWVVEYTEGLADFDLESLPTVPSGSTLSGGTASVTAEELQKGANYEICVPAEGDVCRDGQRGSSAGQLGFGASGVAVDAGGDVYVVDYQNSRVQKFDPEGNLLLTFGTKGAGNGEFTWDHGSLIPGDFIDIGVDGRVYVGDQDRIQEFDDAGQYTGQIEGAVDGELIHSLAVDPDGELYVSLVDPNCCAKEGVLVLGPAGEPLRKLTVSNPMSIALDVAGNVYVNDGGLVEGGEILKFSPAGNPEPAFTFGGGILAPEASLATSSACGIDGADLYVSVWRFFQPSFVRAYGPPPDPDICPPPELPPSIGEQFALSVDSTSAAVKAAINPHFWADTRYHVQYGTGKCSEGGCDRTQPDLPGALLTKEVQDAAISTPGIFLSGLEPATTYHYRFVATSGGGGPILGEERTLRTPPIATSPSQSCPNQEFRAGASARLPDCRAYELVSPLEKNNTDISPWVGINQAATSGNGMTLSSYRGFAGPEGAPLYNPYVAFRSPSTGWLTKAIAPPRDTVSLYPNGGGNGYPYRVFSEDLCSGWIQHDVDIALVPGAPPQVPNLYRRDLCGQGGYELLSTVAPPNFGFEPIDARYYPEVMGFSKDLKRTVFRADDKLTSNASNSKGIFQVYIAFSGQLRLVSTLPNGSPTTSEATVGKAHGVELTYRSDNLYNAVSDDASRVFWSTSPNTTSAYEVSGGGVSAQPAKLYLRLNATEPQSLISGGKCTQPARACTIPVSETPGTIYRSASPGGDRVIYTVGESLFAADIEEVEGAMVAVPQLIAKGVNGFMGASEDATRSYFISTEVLTGEEQNSEGDKAQSGEPNLYLHERGEGFTFVATLAKEDAVAGASEATAPSPVALQPSKRNSRVSADGLHAAFTAIASPTGYDNADANSGKPDAQVFLYDATANGGAGELLCASCNPSGARPSGRQVRAPSNLSDPGDWAAAQIPGWSAHFQPTRALSGDGDRLFFEAYDALLPRDTNGKRDVYQWEAPGSGDCTEASSSFSEANEGCLSLVSSGESPSDSVFLDASPSGSDVFFLTQSSLVEWDYGLADVYDARVNGGLPGPPVPPPACEGEACQGPVAPPNDPTPASSTYQGPGNPKPARANVRKQGKGKKQAKKRRAAKRRAQARKKQKASNKRVNKKRRAGR